ncbi:MAG: energy transducer TonB [Hylemonella sp.]|nr:energy transducer TonB [Hylemonella sp.]
MAAEPVASSATPSSPVSRAEPPAPPRVELPSTDAAYLNNPSPRYPALSRRLGEQGTVLIRVLIEVDGCAAQAEIQRSSGHARLDQAALAAVRSWRYVPGRRGGVVEAMWFTVPVNFRLQ